MIALSTIDRRSVRVLHLRDSPWVDGPARTIIESGVHFDRDRIRYHIGVLVSNLNAPHPMIDEANRRGLMTHRIVDRGGWDRRAVATTLELVDRLRVDVLHTSELRTRILGLLLRRVRPNLVHVTTAHGWIANTRRRKALRLLDKALLRLEDHVIFVSDATCALVPRFWLPDDRVSIVRNALVLGAYGAAEAKAERRVPDARTEVVLLNVGRLSPEKGQDLLILAVAGLLPEYPGIRLHIAGIGPTESQLRGLVHDLGIESRVTFHGFVHDMPSLYAKADLVVQSSLTEGLPNVILEAAYLGVPIVATDVGGTQEVVRHGQEAWLIPPGSLSDLMDGVRQYLKDPPGFLRRTPAAHERILREFSFQTRTERMTSLYERLVVLRQASHPSQEATT